MSINNNGSLGTPLLRDEEHNQDSSSSSSSSVEPVPASLAALGGVRIDGLRKTFKVKKKDFVAVAGLQLDMYEGQIFVLLGHNGAGKTTTINMLTGMLPATSGSADIYGNNTATDMDAIRRTLGLCPQHDILYDDLTVTEHLSMFGAIKGLSAGRLGVAVDEAIADLSLQAKRHALARSLSGGQKRRLSLACALIGDPKVVFLDEPTSGVDPFSRRAIWDALKKKKAGRVIILTTHFMDEADVLGDRIGIMHKGQLECCGSSMFLKRKFGVGYNLVITKEASKDSTLLQKHVETHVDGAELLSDVGTEVSFQLPLAAASSFPSLLTALDDPDQKVVMGCASYGLSVTTMEEVFLKVANDHNTIGEALEQRKSSLKMIARKRSSSDPARQVSERGTSYNAGAGILSGLAEEGGIAGQLHLQSSGEVPLTSERPSALDQCDACIFSVCRVSTFCSHLKALLAKRWHINKRDKKTACCQMVVPLVILALGFGLLRVPPDFTFPELSLEPGVQYNTPLPVPINSDADPVFQDALVEAAMPKSPGDFFLEPLQTCTKQSEKPHPDLKNFSDQLLNSRDNFTSSRYGAIYAPNQFSLLNPRSYIFTNITGDHALPVFMNLASSAYLKKTANHTISASLHPFDFTAKERGEIENLNAAFASIVICIGFAFIPAAVAVFVVKEREMKAKHQQIISGIGIASYWISSLLWDLLNFTIAISLSSLIVLAYGNGNFVGENFSCTYLCFFLFGTSIIPLTYCMSFLFKSHSTAQIVMIMFYLFGGVIMNLVGVALKTIPSTTHAYDSYIRFLFRLVPCFCLGDAMFLLSLRVFVGKSQWDLDICGWDLIFMACESVVYFALCLFIEYRTHQHGSISCCGSAATVLDKPEQEDTDVADERSRVELEATRLSPIVLRGLRKVYPKAKVAAVRDLSFAIPAGQCFGFLGVNGAGKSTTLKMLTGDEVPTRGSAFLNGFDVSTDPQVRRQVGYCPQFDALHLLMTARETLTFYARIRGIRADRIPTMVNFLLDRLTLTVYADRPAEGYSGGNKRKLSVAIALIGDPKVVFLDEPSTGMDPVSRRFMWDFISETMEHRAVILTTHSMEECEALCSRIGIIAHGSLKCIGSSQHLKSRFGRGYQIDISTADNDVGPARQYILDTFSGAIEQECYGGKLKFSVPVLDMPLCKIFTTIEENKAQVGISDYAVGQTTLEQIFIGFAKAEDQDTTET